MARSLLPAKRLMFWGFWGCSLAIALGLSARLLWTASQTETGFHTLQLEWRDATVGWISGSYEPIPCREPLEQAEFWLREVDRVVQRHPNDARVMMGAALTLDSPGNKAYLRLFESGDYLRLPHPDCIAFSEYRRFKYNKDAFERQCDKRCLELARAAARLEPGNIHWWQILALLHHPYNDNPNDADWLKTLDECARHDPDNALYDYLAARSYWNAGISRIDFRIPPRLFLRDAEVFRKGNPWFDRGQAKRCFSVGDVGATAVAEFLAHTRLPLVDHERIVNSRELHMRRSMLVRDLYCYWGLQAEEKASAGDLGAAMEMNREVLHAIGQYTADGPSAAYDKVPMMCKVGTIRRMQRYTEEHAGELPRAEVEQMTALCEAAILEQGAVRQAAMDLTASKRSVPVSPPFLFPSPAPPRPGLFIGPGVPVTLGSLLYDMAPTVIALLLVITLVAALATPWSARGGSPAVGPIGQIATLVAAAAVSVALFGLAPAGLMGRKVQEWFFTGCLILISTGGICWIIWYWLQRQAFQFSIRTMLIATLLLSLLFGVGCSLWPRLRPIAGFPLHLSVPAIGWRQLHVDILSADSVRKPDKWICAALQWRAYQGHSITVLLWAGWLTLLYSLKQWRTRRRNGSAGPNMRNRLTGLFRSVGRPLLVMTVLSLVVYLLQAPRAMEEVEQAFQQKMMFARYPQSYWVEVEKAIQNVRSDSRIMDPLKQEAKTWGSKTVKTGRW